jgi:hypothetical protein
MLDAYHQPTEIFDQIKDLATRERLIEIQYQKAPIDTDPPWRVIEPYTMTSGKQDVMLRAYQIDPEPGWRFFMLHKIKAARDSGKSFRPRRRITAASGQVHHVYDPYESWSADVCEYRDMVLNILADNYPDPSEILALKSFREKNKLTFDNMRSVHGSIFNNCLTHVLVDGLINDEEQDLITRLHDNLKQCGCGVIELKKQGENNERF